MVKSCKREAVVDQEKVEKIKMIRAEAREKSIVELPFFLGEHKISMTEFNAVIHPEDRE